MAQSFFASVPIGEAQIELRPNWIPRGLIISNFSDCVIKVTSSRNDVWRCPPGRTLKRPLFYGADRFTAESETAGTSGEALVVLTQDEVLELSGSDASVASLFRRTVYDRAHTWLGIYGEETRVILGAARVMQITGSALITDVNGYAFVSIREGAADLVANPYLLNIKIPWTVGTNVPFSWMFGPGGDYALPKEPIIGFSGDGSGGLSNSVQLRADVWDV